MSLLLPQSLVVSEDRLAAARDSLTSVTSEHVFSVQRHRVRDTTVLYGADQQERLADPTAFNRSVNRGLPGKGWGFRSDMSEFLCTGKEERTFVSGNGHLPVSNISMASSFANNLPSSSIVNFTMKHLDLLLSIFFLINRILRSECWKLRLTDISKK